MCPKGTMTPGRCFTEIHEQYSSLTDLAWTLRVLADPFAIQAHLRRDDNQSFRLSRTQGSRGRPPVHKNSVPPHHHCLLKHDHSQAESAHQGKTDEAILVAPASLRAEHLRYAALLQREERHPRSDQQDRLVLGHRVSPSQHHHTDLTREKEKCVFVRRETTNECVPKSERKITG